MAADRSARSALRRAPRVRRIARRQRLQGADVGHEHSRRHSHDRREQDDRQQVGRRCGMAARPAPRHPRGVQAGSPAPTRTRWLSQTGTSTSTSRTQAAHRRGSGIGLDWRLFARRRCDSIRRSRTRSPTRSRPGSRRSIRRPPLSCRRAALPDHSRFSRSHGDDDARASGSRRAEARPFHLRGRAARLDFQ